MGLDIGLNVARMGLLSSQEAMNILSQNIANANNDKYCKQEIELSTLYAGINVVGIEVLGVKRAIDENILAELRWQVGDKAHYQTLQDYNDTMQVYLGDPNGNYNINGFISNFFAIVDNLGLNPNAISLKVNAVQSAVSLSTSISSLADELQQLRYQADQDYNASINNINNYTEQIAVLNIAISRAHNNDVSTNSLLDQRDYYVNLLAQEVDVSVYKSGESMIGIISGNGHTLVEGGIQYKLNYSPLTSYTDFFNSPYIAPTTSQPIFPNGTTPITYEIVNGGPTDTISCSFTTGKLSALQQLRDVDIANTIAQLDVLAQSVAFAVNAIHNTGSSFPPISGYTGEQAISAEQGFTFTGQARIAVVDDAGQPLTTANHVVYNPLLLDFNNLTSGSEYGLVNLQTIIDEINQYFYYDPRLSQTKLGNLTDIRLAANSSTIAANGLFNFDFELYNNDQVASSFEVVSVNVFDHSMTPVVGAVTSPLPGIFAVEAGQRVRTKQTIDLDFSSGGGGPYNVQTEVLVTAPNGLIQSAVLNFVIDDTPVDPNILNQRYTATEIVSGDGEIVAGNTTQTFLHAQLVDSNGKVITDGEAGYLQILSENNKAYYLAIDDFTSQELGYSVGNLTLPATNKGFSHFFGLNNLFVEQTELANSAINMQVRKDIAADPALIATSSLFLSKPTQTLQEVGAQKATGSIVFAGSLPIVGDTLTIDGTIFTFKTVAGATNEISIGIDWPSTVANISSVLNAQNLTTYAGVNKATYNNVANNLIVTYQYPGMSGNSFSLDASLSGSARGAINGGSFLAAPTGLLIGGANEPQLVTTQPHSYGLGSGSGAVAVGISKLIDQDYKFTAAGNLPTFSTNLIGYVSAIIGFRSGIAAVVDTNFEQADLLYTAFYDRFRNVSGVNIDEELSQTILYQNAYQASATVITTIRKMFDVLLQAFSR